MGGPSNTVKASSLIGAHVSIAGGMSKAPERGGVNGCTVIQVFTKSPNVWDSPPLDPKECEAFKKNVQRFGIKSVVAHDAYLINLASPDRRLWKRSKAAFLDEMRRCASLGIPALVTHPGSHKGAGEKKGMKRLTAALKEILDTTGGDGVKILLETTAGQGSCLGGRFEDLSEAIDLLGGNRRLGVCFDTCHVFAAGYDISRASSFEKVIQEFDMKIGLDRLQLFHLNDSKGELGSGRDRHEHIGGGKIGLELFRKIVRARRFERVPKIIETPGGVDGGPEDQKNLEILFSMAIKSARA